jgi:hypothetical protein
MKSFKEFLFEDYLNETHTSSHHEDNVHGMGKVLSQFMQHLSSPTWGGLLREKYLNEVTVFDTKNPKLAQRNLPKTTAMIKKGNRELPDENLHKRIHAGFSQALEEMKTEKPEVTQQKAKEARKAYEDFAKSRGFKSGGNMLIENGKTKKSSGEGVHTKGLSLAPHSASGLKDFDVCPRASKECRANCLGTEAGGNRQFPDSALASKVLKTHFLALHPHHAARLLDHEIGQHVKDAEKNGMKAGVRLNVTSDIPYEKFAKHLFERHPTAQFYDYTKIHKRVMDQSKEGHPSNYHLTLSHTGTGHAESNDNHAINALNHGHVVAMVYQRGKGVPEPTHVKDVKTGTKYPIANGDDDDNTFDRHETLGVSNRQGVVSGLRLKGVKNEDAGHFANKVDPDGVIRINK